MYASLGSKNHLRKDPDLTAKIKKKTKAKNKNKNISFLKFACEIYFLPEHNFIAKDLMTFNFK